MKLPADFTVGVATAAYQIEGTRAGGCGRSHWDTFAAEGGTAGGENGDIACDHYNRWEEDLDLIARTGFHSYRFSLSWPRLFPEKARNAEGFDFYDRLIDGMLARGLTPSATLYHWDLPLRYADKGGWANSDTPKYFADYAGEVARAFGDRLPQIATINEPWCVAWLSYFLGHHAPGKRSLPDAAAAMHNILLAHGLAITALRGETNSDLGIVLNMEFAEPASDREADERAAALFDGIYNRWFIQALTKGSYPDDVLEFLEPHMPEGWQADMDIISQRMDWMGLNYYTRSIHADDGTGQFPFNKTVAGPRPKTSMGWEVYPEGLGYFLKRLHQDYTGDLPLYVTENGMAWHDRIKDGVVEDKERIGYLEAHVAETLKAREDGVPVQGYYAWSLLDNFEWAFGYKERFGLVHVDYETQKRTPKASMHWFETLLKNR